MELELEDYRKYVPAALAVLIGLSFVYTASVAGQIDQNTDPAQVRNIVDNKQEPIIDEFDSVISGINSEMEATNSSIDEVGQKVTDVNSSVSDLREEKENLESKVDTLQSDLEDTRASLNELRNWVNNVSDVEVVDTELLDGSTRVTVENTRLDTVNSILVTATYNSSVESTVISSLESGQSSSVTVDRPTNSSMPDVSLQY
jgi:predicted nuclease with TOPRIM domain